MPVPDRRPTRARPRNRAARAVLRLAAAAAVAVLATAAAAGDAESGCPETDVWVVSTRRLPGICRLPHHVPFDVERHDAGGGRWEPADLAGLLEDPARPLVIFIHGNRYDAATAKARGLTVARHLAVRCPGGVRTVIFSWPSAKDGHPIEDGRAKYDRAHADAHYLGFLLGRIEPTRPVAVIGYSFGAIITLGALEDLAVAERSGRTDLTAWTGRPGRTHLVFVAAAVRCDALAPRGPYRDALACIDRLTLVTNSRDGALRFFPWLDRHIRAAALGAVAMPRGWLPEGVEYAATDGAAIIGRQHGLQRYLSSPALTRRIVAGALEGLAP